MASRPRAVLVGVLTPGRDPGDLDASLDELSRLCDTLGMDEVGRLTQRQSSTRKANLLGAGRLRTLARWTGGTGIVERGPQRPRKKGEDEEDEELLDETDAIDGFEEEDEGPGQPPPGPPGEQHADVVVVDHELSPSQLRNLRSATGVEVLDRTGVIIEIFHNRAKSREARLQVELARLTYLAPRLRELGGASERQRGGIGGKGAGESDLELDRRRVRDQMAEIRRELREIDEGRGTRRARRRDLRQVALVGYTNAGKSSLMRALTGSEIYVADQLFATLDTTIRRLVPEAVPPILVTDTVGFIKDLPHSLVASFRSTLDAAIDAGLLLHIVDATDPSWRQQEEVTARVLAEIDSDEVPRVLVFNKCDRLAPEAEAALFAERPDAWFTAAHDPARVVDLHRRITLFFDKDALEEEILIPWDRAALMGRVRAEAQVLEERFEDEGVYYRLRGRPEAIRRLKEAADG